MTDFNGPISFGSTITPAGGVIAPSYTFATLPAPAAGNTGAEVFVSDVGTNGSSWRSNGTVWSPVNGEVNLYASGLPFVFPPSSSIAVTTGAITYGTALDVVYASSYQYFPAGAWTGSAAGWYYVTMSSTTSGLVYSNTYTSGVPTIPGSPTLVTTGAGAFTQTTAAYVAGPNFSIQGNVMGAYGKLDVDFLGTNYSSAGSKYLQPSFGGTGLTSTHQTTISPLQNKLLLTNQGVANSQFYLNSNTNYGSVVNGNAAIDTTAAKTFQINFYLTVATDWVVLQYLNVKASR